MLPNSIYLYIEITFRARVIQVYGVKCQGYVLNVSVPRKGQNKTPGQKGEPGVCPLAHTQERVVSCE
nr:MAG TPA: hypothetical protein [Caudoviricetes sp.]